MNYFKKFSTSTLSFWVDALGEIFLLVDSDKQYNIKQTKGKVLLCLLLLLVVRRVIVKVMWT